MPHSMSCEGVAGVPSSGTAAAASRGSGWTPDDDTFHANKAAASADAATKVPPAVMARAPGASCEPFAVLAEPIAASDLDAGSKRAQNTSQKSAPPAAAEAAAAMVVPRQHSDATGIGPTGMEIEQSAVAEAEAPVGMAKMEMAPALVPTAMRSCSLVL